MSDEATVERVARAIYEASIPKGGKYYHTWDDLESEGFYAQHDLAMKQAKAAIAALQPQVSPELIDKLGKLATYLTEQGEYEACDLIDTVVERVTKPALQPQDGWQDIATAPKDGTRVLLMSRGPKPPEMIARWAQEWTTEEGDDAFEWVNDEDDVIYGTPTHWAALPASPAAEIERTKG